MRQAFGLVKERKCELMDRKWERMGEVGNGKR
jgi:hypothetical protein